MNKGINSKASKKSSKFSKVHHNETWKKTGDQKKKMNELIIPRNHWITCYIYDLYTEPDQKLKILILL